MGELGLLLGVFIAKSLSIAGLGALVAGFFVPSRKVAAVTGIAFGVLDTALLHVTRPTGAGVMSVVAAIVVASIWVQVSYSIAQVLRRKRQAKA